MRELIERIRQQAILLEYKEDSIALDKDLGEIECLIHAARQEIDDEWRAARDMSRAYRKLGLAIVSLKPEKVPELHELLRDMFNE